MEREKYFLVQTKLKYTSLNKNNFIAQGLIHKSI